MPASAVPPLFSSALLPWASDHGETLQISSDRTLIFEGVRTPDLYLLLEGNGRVCTAREGGEPVELALIGPGQIVGEMSLLEGCLPVVTVVGLPGSRWIRADYHNLLQAMAADSALASATYQLFAVKLALQLSYQNALVHQYPVRDANPLRKVQLVLGEWTELDVGWLANHGRRVDVVEGETFIQEGQSLDALFLVLDGDADVLIDVNGTPACVGRARRGEILGEMSFLGDDTATATVTARSPMLLLALDKALIREHLGHDPSFGERFFRSLAVLLSHRCRDQLMSRGLAAEAAAAEELDLTTLGNLSSAGRRFEWLCQDVVRR